MFLLLFINYRSISLGIFGTCESVVFQRNKRTGACQAVWYELFSRDEQRAQGTFKGIFPIEILSMFLLSFNLNSRRKKFWTSSFRSKFLWWGDLFWTYVRRYKRSRRRCISCKYHACSLNAPSSRTTNTQSIRHEKRTFGHAAPLTDASMQRWSWECGRQQHRCA